MNWRPEGWKNIKQIAAPLARDEAGMKACERYNHLFEAGADAMLEALRKQALPPDDYAEGLYLLNENDALVLIPEDEE